MNTEQLKAVALKATPGPWVYVRLDEWSHSVYTKHGELPDGLTNGWEVAQVNKLRKPENEANAAYIASANPATILALLECVDALRMAVRQNDHDMLMIGEELRQCRAALQKLEAL